MSMEALHTPINGFTKSLAFTFPVAYKRLRCGARSTPTLIILLLISENTSNISCSIHSKSYIASRQRSEEHTSELQSRFDLVCRLLLEKIKTLLLTTQR